MLSPRPRRGQPRVLVLSLLAVGLLGIGILVGFALGILVSSPGGDGPAASPPIVDQTAPDATPTPSATPASTPLPFYTRFEEAAGIVIKAPESVAPQALQNAQEVVAQMLSGRPGIRDRLASQVAAVAIIPRDAYVTVLPEFSYLSGRLDRNREPYDSFATRGLGGVTGQPVTATSEENILMLPGDPFAGESILHHEFAHAIMNMGFTDEDRERWSTIYEEAVAAGRFRDTFAITRPDEYFAKLSQAYFSFNDEIGDPADILAEDPNAHAFLRDVYGPA